MTPYYRDDWLTVYHGDCQTVMAEMEPESVHCVVTSPPYWGLRDYGEPGQLGLEATPNEYVANLVAVFREVRRVLRVDGTVWLNLGDSYASQGGLHDGREDNQPNVGASRAWRNGSGRADGIVDDRGQRNRNGNAVVGLKPKDLVGIPWRVAFALQADGWYLRSDIIWSKPNPMPESVTDRPTKSHEYLFLLSKSPRYYFDADAVREDGAGRLDLGRMKRPEARLGEGGGWHLDNGFRDEAGRNIRSVWTIATTPYGNVRVERAGYGGSGHRASPDCPEHGDLSRKVSTAGRGERLDASDPDRNPRTDHRPSPEPLDEPAPIALPPAVGSALDSSGSPAPESGSTATRRSNESRRTAPAPATSQRETDAEGSWSRTERTSPGTGSAANGVHSPASSTAAGFVEGDRRPSSPAGTPGHSACTCTYWESVSHFAVFPPKLVEPCIKAGTSEKGVCPECGAPWERVVERGSPQPVVESSELDRYGTGDAGVHRKVGGQYQKWLDANPPETTGWQPPKCRHRDSYTGLHDLPVPATVLDPFAGSGTTGMVAQSLSRRAVLIDLSLDYLDQLMDRNAEIPLGLSG